MKLSLANWWSLTKGSAAWWAAPIDKCHQSKSHSSQYCLLAKHYKDMVFKREQHLTQKWWLLENPNRTWSPGVSATPMEARTRRLKNMWWIVWHIQSLDKPDLIGCLNNILHCLGNCSRHSLTKPRRWRQRHEAQHQEQQKSNSWCGGILSNMSCGWWRRIGTPPPPNLTPSLKHPRKDASWCSKTWKPGNWIWLNIFDDELIWINITYMCTFIYI